MSYLQEGVKQVVRWWCYVTVTVQYVASYDLITLFGTIPRYAHAFCAFMWMSSCNKILHTYDWHACEYTFKIVTSWVKCPDFVCVELAPLTPFFNGLALLFGPYKGPILPLFFEAFCLGEVLAPQRQARSFCLLYRTGPHPKGGVEGGGRTPGTCDHWGKSRGLRRDKRRENTNNSLGMPYLVR